MGKREGFTYALTAEAVGMRHQKEVLIIGAYSASPNLEEGIQVGTIVTGIIVWLPGPVTRDRV